MGGNLRLKTKNDVTSTPLGAFLLQRVWTKMQKNGSHVGDRGESPGPSLGGQPKGRKSLEGGKPTHIDERKNGGLEMKEKWG